MSGLRDLTNWFVRASFDEKRQLRVPMVIGEADDEPVMVLVEGGVQGTRLVVSVTGDEYKLGPSKCGVASAERDFLNALPSLEPVGTIGPELRYEAA